MLAGRAVKNLMEIIRLGIIDVQFEKEAVELSFRQRICSLHLDRILRGQHEEGSMHRMLLSSHGDLPFLHRFQQSALSLGVARLISSARTIFAKMGPGSNRNRFAPCSSSTMRFVPMMSEGIKSGVN